MFDLHPTDADARRFDVRFVHASAPEAAPPGKFILFTIPFHANPAHNDDLPLFKNMTDIRTTSSLSGSPARRRNRRPIKSNVITSALRTIYSNISGQSRHSALRSRASFRCAMNRSGSRSSSKLRRSTKQIVRTTTCGLARGCSACRSAQRTRPLGGVHSSIKSSRWRSRCVISTTVTTFHANPSHNSNTGC